MAHLRTGGQTWVGFPSAPEGAPRKLCRDVLAARPAGFLCPFDGKELRPRKGVTVDATLPNTKARVPVGLSTLSHSWGSRVWIPLNLSPPAPHDPHGQTTACPTRAARGPRLEGGGCSGAWCKEGGPPRLPCFDTHTGVLRAPRPGLGEQHSGYKRKKSERPGATGWSKVLGHTSSLVAQAQLSCPGTGCPHGGTGQLCQVLSSGAWCDRSPGAPLPGPGALSSPWPLVYTSTTQSLQWPQSPRCLVQAPWLAPCSLTCNLPGLTLLGSLLLEAWHLLAAPSVGHACP